MSKKLLIDCVQMYDVMSLVAPAQHPRFHSIFDQQSDNQLSIILILSEIIVMQGSHSHGKSWGKKLSYGN